MTGGIGHGLPWWLPEGFLNVERTLALGEMDLYLDPGLNCPACVAGIPKKGHIHGIMDPAHIVNKGMGGRKKGCSGPTVRICRPHHDLLHFSNDGIQRCMAIRDTDGAVCWLEAALGSTLSGKGDIQITVLGKIHPGAW